MGNKRRKKQKASISTKGGSRKNTPINIGPFDIGNELKKAVQYHQAGKLPEAEKIYRKILTVDPNHSDSLHLLGLIAHQAGKSRIAVELIHKAIRNRPHNPVYYNNLGNVLKDQGRLDDAVSCFQKALRLNPDAAETCINLGNALKFQGKIEAAEAIYRKALSIKPDFISAYYNLAQLKAWGENDETFKSLDSIQKNRHLSAKETVELHFTLGKVYADSGDHDRAFQNYYAGNEFKKNAGNRRLIWIILKNKFHYTSKHLIPIFLHAKRIAGLKRRSRFLLSVCRGPVPHWLSKSFPATHMSLARGSCLLSIR